MENLNDDQMDQSGSADKTKRENYAVALYPKKEKLLPAKFNTPVKYKNKQQKGNLNSQKNKRSQNINSANDNSTNERNEKEENSQAVNPKKNSYSSKRNMTSVENEANEKLGVYDEFEEDDYSGNLKTPIAENENEPIDE